MAKGQRAPTLAAKSKAFSRFWAGGFGRRPKPNGQEEGESFTFLFIGARMACEILIERLNFERIFNNEGLISKRFALQNGFDNKNIDNHELIFSKSLKEGPAHKLIFEWNF